jgi:hypothetical protein
MRVLVTAASLAAIVVAAGPSIVSLGSAEAASSASSVGEERLDLSALLAAGKLQVVNRQARPLDERPGAIYLNEDGGQGVAWIAGTDFGLGTIAVTVRGRDVPQRSFVGVAFHGRDDQTYEAVYLRPFNFRNADVARRQNAVQYIAMPEFDWAPLRKAFPSEFENPVDESIDPAGWVPLRLVIMEKSVQVFVGPAQSPTLEVRRLGQHDGGRVGLWAGNGSDGAYADLTMTSR